MIPFSEDTVAFLRDLSSNNSRDWFHANKKRYETSVKAPAADVSAALADEVAHLTDTPHKAKIFRINRDVRFSKDKTPYNTHIHIALSPEEGGGVAPMWFFGLDTQKLVLGAGVFEFPKDRLDSWRERVADDDGADLLTILNGLRANGARVAEPSLKRVPKPWSSDHPHEDLLRRKGLSVWIDLPDTSMALGADAPARCAKTFETLLPVVRWLNKPV
ncbi:MAG: DUF2461 domain-containing protein [Ahrensia sp.]|nr:DUF2461 domain-containing protein [Ahrensia sp.]